MSEWQTAPQIEMYDAETATRLKLVFAAALLRHPHNPYEAAREVEPVETGRANWIVNNWLNDPEVIKAMGERVADVGSAIAGLPTKEELALAIYREAGEVKDKSTKLAYFRAVGDIMGYIPRGGGPTVNVNNNNNIMNQPKIQRVPVFATDEDWERKAKMVEERLAASGG
jgi:hypothetical protein